MLDRILKIIRRQPDSKTVAKNRLQLILIQDRAVANPELLDTLKDDLINLLSKYFEINQSEKVDVDIHRENETLAFIASVPISRMKVRPAEVGFSRLS